MPTRTAEAEWHGGLQEGEGTLRAASGAVDAHYSFGTRFEDAHGSNPEELIGAAHAACFSMALAKLLGDRGHKPERIHTTAQVHLDRHDGEFRIGRVDLETEGVVLGLDVQRFEEYAETAARECPVSKALAGTEISVSAKLVG